MAGRVYCSSLKVTGSKNRVATTEDYGRRLLYCYETTSPMFGDLGSGVIGQDGLCYVSIDDLFSETVRTDLDYQVFLQKCGNGDLWVSDKTPTHFIVQGTPGLAFDWELKCRQTGFESERIEESDLQDITAYGDESGTLEDMYFDEMTYTEEIESLLLGAA